MQCFCWIHHWCENWWRNPAITIYFDSSQRFNDGEGSSVLISEDQKKFNLQGAPRLTRLFCPLITCPLLFHWCACTPGVPKQLWGILCPKDGCITAGVLGCYQAVERGQQVTKRDKSCPLMRNCLQLVTVVQYFQSCVLRAQLWQLDVTEISRILLLHR